MSELRLVKFRSGINQPSVSELVLVQFRPEIKAIQNWGWCSLEIKQPSVSELRLVQFRSKINQPSVSELGLVQLRDKSSICVRTEAGAA